MPLNPYQPPGARLADPPAQSERGWLRLSVYYALVMVGLAFIAFSDFRYPQPVYVRPIFLIPLSLLAIGFGLRVARGIWLLDARPRPRWVRPLIIVAMLVGLMAALRLKDSGHPAPQGADLYIPMFLYLLITTAATVVTEHRKGVRVYFGRQRLIFEHGRL